MSINPNGHTEAEAAAHELFMLAGTGGDREFHPCDRQGCDNTVPYDDEPYCFTHSPDSGSDVPGYSYRASHPTV